MSLGVLLRWRLVTNILPGRIPQSTADNRTGQTIVMVSHEPWHMDTSTRLFSSGRVAGWGKDREGEKGGSY